MNYECKRNKEVRRPVLRKPRRRSKHQGKTSKLIAYLSTRMCKICQCNVHALSNNQISILENSVICQFKLVKIVPN